MTGPTPRRVAERLAAGVGLGELNALEPRLARLEEGVAENDRLAGPLEGHLDRIESSLLPLLERAVEDHGA